MDRLFFLLILLLATQAQAAEVKYTGGGLRDPFAEKAVEKVDNSAQLAAQRIQTSVVQGVLVSANNPQAIINGKIYRIGSQLETGKIVAIDKTGVTVLSDGKNVFIPHLKKGASNDKAKTKTV